MKENTVDRIQEVQPSKELKEIKDRLTNSEYEEVVEEVDIDEVNAETIVKLWNIGRNKNLLPEPELSQTQQIFQQDSNPKPRPI